MLREEMEGGPGVGMDSQEHPQEPGLAAAACWRHWSGGGKGWA